MIGESTSEEEIRAASHQRNDKGRDKAFPSRDKWYTGEKDSRLSGDETFRDTIAAYIDSIPLDPTKLKSCRTCEGILCGLCGECHDLDRKSWHDDHPCPVAHPIYQDDPCVMWSNAYLFLKQERGKRHEQNLLG